MTLIEDLLTLADASVYYERGAEPWKRDIPRDPDKLTPEKLAEADDKAHDNIKLLLRDRDRLQSNLFTLRKALRLTLYVCGLAVVGAWSPLWLPLLMHLAGLK